MKKYFYSFLFVLVLIQVKYTLAKDCPPADAGYKDSKYPICIEYDGMYVLVSASKVQTKVTGNKLSVNLADIYGPYFLDKNASLDLLKYLMIIDNRWIELLDKNINPEDITEITFPHTAECFTYPGCFFKLVKNAEVLCPTDGSYDINNDPDIKSYDGDTHYYCRTHREHCGFKCCEQVYTIKYDKETQITECTGKFVRDLEGSACPGNDVKRCFYPYDNVDCKSDCKKIK